jgi:hypothetical protein
VAAANYLKSKNLDLGALGIDASARAGLVKERAQYYKRFWADPFYSTWDNYRKMPEEVLFALRAPGSISEEMVYDDEVLEVIRTHLLEWEWTPPFLEGFIKRAVDLPPAWAQKLRDVFPVAKS